MLRCILNFIPCFGLMGFSNSLKTVILCILTFIQVLIVLVCKKPNRIEFSILGYLLQADSFNFHCK